MTSSITLNETMSGWIQNNKDGKSEPFSFTITVFFANRLNPLAPQPFKGKVRFDERDYETLVEGELTLKPTGPRYDMDFSHPDLGLVRVAGEKTYSLANLPGSLVTCPLTVYQCGAVVGDAEVAYRDSMLEFPFKALGFTTQTAAFLPYQTC
ncbi:hypothetical protein A9Q99_18375 [Gammaproteobacteria bacterium 45_16_T64]|nr:hypothetical protein A9Q99_18375 [Gammaproteobacteria bacterium 45_16_T64]